MLPEHFRNLRQSGRGWAGQRTAVRPKCMPPIWMEKKLPAMPNSAAMVISVPNARPRFSGANMSATSDWLAGNTSARPSPVHAAHVAAWARYQLSAPQQSHSPVAHYTLA